MSEKKIAILNIYDPIGESESGLFADFKAFGIKNLSEFLEANSEATDIKVNLFTPGGSVTMGYAIHDKLINSGKTITTIIEGRCNSISTVIALAGTIRKIYQNNTEFIIHNPFIPEFTLANAYDSEALKEIAQELENQTERLAKFYSEKTSIKLDEVKELMKAQTNLTNAQALEFGFVTEIVEPLKMVAYFSNNKSNQNNNIMSKEILDEVQNQKGILQKIWDKLTLKPEIVNMMLTQKSGEIIEVITEAEEIKVGDAVKVNGETAPDATYELVDGKSIVVVNGLISEIIEVVEETEAEKKLKELEAKLTEKDTEIANKQTQIDELTAKVESNVAITDAVKLQVTELSDKYTALASTIESKGIVPNRTQNFDKPKGEVTKKSMDEIIAERNEKRKQTKK